MKKFDVKKLLVFILIIAVLVVIAVLAIKTVKKDKVKPEEQKAAEEIVTTYFQNISRGYSTIYGGLDVLYSHDKVTSEDLNEQEIVLTATSYLDDHDVIYTIGAEAMEGLEKSKLYGNLNLYSIYSGSSVRQTIKDLFGIEQINAVPSSSNYLYDIYYDNTYDCYLIKRNDAEDLRDENASMDYSIISTESKDGKLEVVVAVAYVYNDEGNITYMKDPNGKQVVVDKLEKKEFPKDKIDEFDKYKFTLKVTEDNKYTFESMEKLK